MIDESNSASPEDIQHWPVWALELRDEFAMEAYKMQQPWDSFETSNGPNRVIADSVACATAYVRALYPKLDEDVYT